MEKISFGDIIHKDLNYNNIIAIELLWQAKFKYSYQEKSRPDSGIILILSKGVVFCENDNTIYPNIGDILYIPTEAKYYVYCENDNTVMKLINFTATDCYGNQVVFSDKIIKIASEKKDFFDNNFSELIDIYINSVSNKLTVKIKLLEILLRLSEVSETKHINAPIYNAVTYINNNLICDIKIPELARICAVSESTLRREFKIAFGVSPIEYINSEKIKKAKNMLKHSFLTVSDISNALGFYDEAYFCKLFKRITGVTPSKYRLDFVI